MFTYAKYGRAILAEPGAKAYQIFDSQVFHLLEPRYATSEPITAIRSFGDKNVTKQAIELSRTAIIDTIGVTLAGSATRSHSSGVRPVPEDFLGQGAARGECSGNLVIQLVLWLTPIMLVTGGWGARFCSKRRCNSLTGTPDERPRAARLRLISRPAPVHRHRPAAPRR